MGTVKKEVPYNGIFEFAKAQREYWDNNPRHEVYLQKHIIEHIRQQNIVMDYINGDTLGTFIINNSMNTKLYRQIKKKLSVLEKKLQSVKMNIYKWGIPLHRWETPIMEVLLGSILRFGVIRKS